ncbi:MAG: LamG-like jellyroll fold domain-containing protein [Myxococcota bacterium]
MHRMRPRPARALFRHLLLGLVAMLVACGDDGPGGTFGVDGGNPASCDALADPNGDSDSDGRTNCEEITGYAISVDTLGFGLDSDNSDRLDVTSDPNDADSDDDGLDDLAEFMQRSNPRAVDTDADGLSDFDEVMRWRTSPRTVDTDDDATDGTGRNPVVGLWDGAELALAMDPSGRMVPGVGATDPTDRDTDGDGRSDLEEFDDTILDPVVADLPSLQLELTSDPDIRLNYTTTETGSVEQSVGTELSRTSTNTLARSDSTSTTLSAELSLSVSATVEASFPPSASVTATATATVGVERSQATEVSRENSLELGRAQSTGRSVSREEGFELTTGQITTGVRLTNDGDITYRVAGVNFLVQRYDPLSREAEPLALLSLPDALSDGFVLQPDQNVEAMLAGLDLDASLVQEFLQNPSALFFEPIQPDLRDAEDTSFSFLDQTRGKTALLVVDEGAGAEPLRLRVATNIDRTDEGTLAGTPLGTVLANANVDFTTEERDGTEVLASVQGTSYEVRSGAAPDLGDPDYGAVGGPGARTAERFWVVIGSRDPEVQSEFGPLDTTGDISALRIQNRDQLRLVFVRDADGDGVYDREEFLNGAVDSNTDTDGDGLSDYFEIRVGWDVLGTRVFPSPAVDDFDGDGWDDPTELAAGTDPRNADTDGDGVEDDLDIDPLVPAMNMPPTVTGLSVALTRVVGMGYEVRVTGTATDTDGTVAAVIFDWGDGTTDTIDGGDVNALHTYAMLTEQTIDVSARDNVGAEGAAASVSIDPIPPGELFKLEFSRSVVDTVSGRAIRVSNSPRYISDRRGRGNSAADFFAMGSSGSGVLASTNGFGLTGDQTIAIWVQFPLIQSGRRIVGTDQGLQIYLNSGRVQFGWAERFADSSSERGPSVSFEPMTGEWYHIVGVLRGSTLELFVDGVSQGTATNTRTIAGACRFFVGTYPGDDLCTGDEADEFANPPVFYDDVAVYDRALTAGQIAVLAAL